MIHNTNAFDGVHLLADNSVDCLVTSPPYWGLRDYGVPGQMGAEDTPDEFISTLCNLFDSLKPKLKDTATLFVNLGDTYGGSGAGTTTHADTDAYIENSKQTYVLPGGNAKSNAYRGTPLDKSCLLIPYKFAIRMQDRGWTVRNMLIWHKPNAMPSSVKDRFTVDYESVMFFTKQPRGYYFNQLFEPISDATKTRAEYGWKGKLMANGEAAQGMKRVDKMGNRFAPEQGRNMRATWSINTQSYKGDHFATFPEELARRCIEAGCPVGGLVLDPFMGAGTTALVAKKLGRQYVGFEINPDYVRQANERLHKELGIFNQ